jgi:hypothetical protein
LAAPITVEAGPVAGVTHAQPSLTSTILEMRSPSRASAFMEERVGVAAGFFVTELFAGGMICMTERPNAA